LIEIGVPFLVTPRYVPMRAPNWAIDPDELKAAFNDRTRAIIVIRRTTQQARFIRARS